MSIAHSMTGSEPTKMAQKRVSSSIGAGYGVGLGHGPGPSHYVPPPATHVAYQLGSAPPLVGDLPPGASGPPPGSQLLSYGQNLSPHHIHHSQNDLPQSKRRR
ncbi:hypothetical protein PV326_009468 [Microctonus aethiopoides]|nr:hypothetical protein PV326_009468 [Microctonus aethiopoides]